MPFSQIFVAFLECNNLKERLNNGFLTIFLYLLGWTPLHEAAVHYGAQIQDILELLVTKGADINARANNGSTPLHDAIMFLPEVNCFLN